MFVEGILFVCVHLVPGYQGDRFSRNPSEECQAINLQNEQSKKDSAEIKYSTWAFKLLCHLIEMFPSPLFLLL